MEFKIERAVPGDYRLFADIIQAVWEAMPQKEWFMADNADYTYRMLVSGGGRGYKAVETDSGETAGVFMAAIPGLGRENLGYDIGLGKEELLLAAHMDSVAVLPRYRGHGLQRRLMQAAEADLTKQGFCCLMCTVHPDNRYSRDNVISQGYRPVAVKEKYGGHIREIFLKKTGGQGADQAGWPAPQISQHSS